MKNCGGNAFEALLPSQFCHPQQPGYRTLYLANTFQKNCELSDCSPLFWLFLWIGLFICIRHVRFLKWAVFIIWGHTCVLSWLNTQQLQSFLTTLSWSIIFSSQWLNTAFTHWDKRKWHVFFFLEIQNCSSFLLPTFHRICWK